jgi:hypothetical protein
MANFYDIKNVYQLVFKRLDYKGKRQISYSNLTCFRNTYINQTILKMSCITNFKFLFIINTHINNLLLIGYKIIQHSKTNY